MCLAVPAKIVDAAADEAVVDLLGNRLRISIALTPHVAPGEWVLVHAGFAIATIAERDALETWEYLRGEVHDSLMAEAGAETAATTGGP